MRTTKVVMGVMFMMFIGCSESSQDEPSTTDETNGDTDVDAKDGGDTAIDAETDGTRDGDTADNGSTDAGNDPGEVPIPEPCGSGWGSDLIPGSLDLGLASNPEINAIPNGSADEQAVFGQINDERIAEGLSPLQWSDQVANAARSHAADMNQQGYFDHGSATRPYRVDGVTNRDNWLPLPRLEFLYPGDFRRCGENIASTRNPVENAVTMWMNSPGHRAAILDEYGWEATIGGIGIDDRMVVFKPAQCAR